jgi:hypothetical protein
VFNNTPAVVSVVIFVPLTVNVVISLVAARLIVVIDTHTPVTVSVLAIAEAVKFNVDNLSACWNSKSDACDSSVKVFTVPQLPSDEVAVKLFTVTTGPPGPFAGPALRVIVETPIALVVNLGAKNVDTVVLVKLLVNVSRDGAEKATAFTIVKSPPVTFFKAVKSIIVAEIVVTEEIAVILAP